jgi:hypothetical protein
LIQDNFSVESASNNEHRRVNESFGAYNFSWSLRAFGSWGQGVMAWRLGADFYGHVALTTSQISVSPTRRTPQKPSKMNSNGRTAIIGDDRVEMESIIDYLIRNCVDMCSVKVIRRNNT